MRITAIKQQLKRADRYSVYVDGKYAFSLSESALLEQGLVSGQELDPAQLRALKETSGADKAYGNALRYAVMRPHSKWEMQTYLQRRKVDELVATSILKRLAGLDLVDDQKFAEAWVSNRRLLKNTSKRRLRLELKQKHVPESIIDAVLRQDTVIEQDSLRALIEKKRIRYPDQTKLMQYLARQGFMYDDIKTALEELRQEEDD